MTTSELFTAAHKLAKTFEGNYVACFTLALEEIRNNSINSILEIELKKNVTYGATSKQFNYLETFSNVEFSIVKNRFMKRCTSKQASEIIEKAKQGIEILIY